MPRKCVYATRLIIDHGRRPHSHGSCALWGNPYVVSCGCCWTYPTLLIGIERLLHTAATLFQIYSLHCMVCPVQCPCYLTDAITCIQWWDTHEQRGATPVRGHNPYYRLASTHSCPTTIVAVQRAAHTAQSMPHVLSHCLTLSS